MQDCKEDLALLQDAGAAAGAMALSYFRNDPRAWLKNESSLVSEADMAVDQFLRDTLCAARPTYGWLSEETADNDVRLSKSHVFVIDPIDGTRAFLKGKPHWCISLSVVAGQHPCVGVLVAPALEQTYTATHGGGAWRSGERLHCAAPSSTAATRIADLPKDGPWSRLTSCTVLPSMPSLALRFAGVAAGEIDLAFARPNACDWDIAAAHLLIKEAGGCVLDANGQAPVYNRKDVHQPGLVAGSAAMLALHYGRF